MFVDKLLVITIYYLFYRLSINSESLATCGHQIEYSRNGAVDIRCVINRMGNTLKVFRFVNTLVKKIIFGYYILLHISNYVNVH